MANVACRYRRFSRDCDAGDEDVPNLDGTPDSSSLSRDSTCFLCGGIIERDDPPIQIFRKHRFERLLEHPAVLSCGHDLEAESDLENRNR